MMQHDSIGVLRPCSVDALQYILHIGLGLHVTPSGVVDHQLPPRAAPVQLMAASITANTIILQVATAEDSAESGYVLPTWSPRDPTNVSPDRMMRRW
jgi:hypothetical protein